MSRLHERDCGKNRFRRQGMSHLPERLRIRALLGGALRRALRLWRRYEGIARRFMADLSGTMRSLPLRHRRCLRSRYRTLVKILMRRRLIGIVMLCVVFVPP
jgi:hypothetical protein